jgi:hypothetical protein
VESKPKTKGNKMSNETSNTNEKAVDNRLPLTNAGNAQGCTCSAPTSNRYTLKDRGDGEVAPHCSGCGEELEL